MKLIKRILILINLSLIMLVKNTFAVESPGELKSMSSTMQPLIIIPIIFWGVVIFLIVI